MWWRCVACDVQTPAQADVLNEELEARFQWMERVRTGRAQFRSTRGPYSRLLFRSPRQREANGGGASTKSKKGGGWKFWKRGK